MQRTFKNGQRLTEDETKAFRSGACPDCGARALLQGPSGGLSENVYCGNEERCGSRYNEMGPFGVDRISDTAFKGPYRDHVS